MAAASVQVLQSASYSNARDNNTAVEATAGTMNP
jgi:hypothetical protein